jgi:hypothetical protein
LREWLNDRNIKAVSLALLLFIYPILILSTASVRYTETIHRVTTSQTFDETLFGSGLADSLAALGFSLLFASLTFRSKPVRLASIAIFAAGTALYIAGSDVLLAIGIATLPVLVGSLIAIGFATKKKSEETGRPVRLQPDAIRVAGALLLIIIILEIGAAARWVTYPFFPTEMYSGPSWRFAQLESALFHSLGLLSPFLIVLVAFSFVYKWYILEILGRIKNAFQNQRHPTSLPESDKRPSTRDPQPGGKLYREEKYEPKADAPVVVTTFAAKPSTKLARNVHWMILSAALVIAPLLVMYPHLQGINPTGSGISTDEQYYMNWMSKLRADPGSTWIDSAANAFTINKGDRPLTLLIILALANLTGSPDLMVIRYLPVALAPLLVLANYFLLRRSLRSRDGEGKLKFYASVGAMFAVFSPQIVVGQYAGLLANWMALVAAYFAFYFLIRGWESQNRKQMASSFGILLGILVVMMLVHLYTWAHLLAIILLFAGMSFVFSRRSVTTPKIKLAVMLIVVGTAFAIDYAKSSYFITPTAAGSESAIGTNITPQDATGRWDRLFFTLHTYVGGFLSNPALLLLSLVWLVRADLSKGLDRLLLSMFFILAVPITFGSIEFQTRVLYNIPFHIPALLAIYGIGLGKEMNASRALLILAIALTFATFALRAMANLYLELPEGYVLDEQFLLP